MSEEEKDPENTSNPTEEKPQSNIEKYNEKVKAEGIKPKVSEKVLELQTNLYNTLLETAPQHSKGYADIMKKKGDMDSAILILKEGIKNEKAKSPAPNTSSIPQPVGIPKTGLAKYMTYVPGTDKISWSIPMSELMDPEKNKKLGDYN